jgi:hypothetical protein
MACVCSVRKLNISPQEFPIPGRAVQTANGGLYVRTHGLTSSATSRAGAILWVQYLKNIPNNLNFTTMSEVQLSNYLL